MDLSSLKNKKTALVLSGGVVKAGAWHLGVSSALEELGYQFLGTNPPASQNDLQIGTYVGSSAGGLISLCLANNYRPYEIMSTLLKPGSTPFKKMSYKDMLSFRSPEKKPPRNKDYEPFKDLPFVLREILRPLVNFSGLFTTVGIANYLKKHVIKCKNFEEYAADLFIVATQLDHSRKVIFSKYHYPDSQNDEGASYYTGIPVLDAVAASMSVPPLYSPYPIKNPLTNKIDYYIDGDIRDTLSTHVAQDNHCEVIISSWTHTPYHYHETIGSLINYGLPAICIQSIYLMIQKKILTHRKKVADVKDVIESVSSYMKSEKMPEEQRRKIIDILEAKMKYNPNLKLIDICPTHDNYEFFFSSFFSLNPESSSEAMRMGYERTMEVFREL